MSLIGLRFYFRTTGHGTLHCQRCGGDRPYQRCTGRRWFHVLRIPLIPLDRIGEHVQCRACRTRYRLEVLAHADDRRHAGGAARGVAGGRHHDAAGGDPASAPARSRAVEMLRAAGLAGYDEAALTADLAAADGRGRTSRAPLRTLAIQLTMPAPEWFLADAVRVGWPTGRCRRRNAARPG